MTKIKEDTSVYDLVTAHPDIRAIMAELGFMDILKPGMLQTAGRVMTLKKGAALKKLDWSTILAVFNKNGYEISKEEQ